MSHLLRKLTIRRRLALLLAMVFIASLVMTLIPISYTSSLFVQTQKDLTRIQVETAKQVVTHYHQLEVDGALSRVEAKQLALATLEAAALDNRNYFYVYHEQNFIVMHPFLKQQSYPDEPASIRAHSRQAFLESLNEIARELGRTGNGLASVDFLREEHPDDLTGFFDYYLYVAPSGNAILTRVDDPALPDRAEQKMGYGSFFEPWEWVIFGGVFLDDSDRIYQELLRQMLLPGLLVLILLVLVTYIISQSITSPLSETVKRLEQINNARSWNSNLSESDPDEIGSLSKSFNQMFQRLQRHIEEEKVLEERLRHAQKLEAVGQLTGGIAHDFNNLLTIVQGNLELAMEETDSEERQKLLLAANQASERGALLVQRLLVYSRKQSLIPLVTNLNDLLEGTKFLIERSIGENIQVTMNRTPDLWMCEIDRAQMENCLVNLAINARDAMPTGGELTISTNNFTLSEDNENLTAGDYVSLSVQDTGSGIEPKLLEKIFEPFFTTKLPGQGSGLGLSMVYGFVAQSHGTVEVTSTSDKGTEITLLLPRVQGEASLNDLRETATLVHGNGETVLILEDDDELRQTSKKMLQGLGYKTITAGNTNEALDHLNQQQDIRLLMTDMVLSEHRTGVSMANLAREKRPNLPVLYVSGYSEHPALKQGDIQAGVNFLAKPFSKSALSQMVAKLLD